ncbi:protein kinase domain-containing protein [Prosthecobacter sp.]|uniref:protein kinase domain-containing protein n=1 Tax=Prosthecobacter sp. TaxID=1965333 RepID=UPI003783806D
MHCDQFQPEKILAAGPSAKVYRGVETATGRKVLIKAVLQDDETVCPLDRDRVQQLAPSLMQMRHPHIARLITLLPMEDELAFVSEFTPGMNGRAFDAEHRPSPSDVRMLAVQLMHALQVGENLRQPHGDPKPSNLIIADHPSGGLFLQVQDWGLSLAREKQPPETLWFRAPELHAGGPPTMQSDLFTAAGSLFCIATNTSPTLGTTAEEIQQDWQAFDACELLDHLRPDLDQPLRDWLAWLLSVLPQQRPKSVSQALKVLMQSMPAGSSYQAKQPPVMAPGAKTTQLGSKALKSRPVLTKAASAPAAATLPLAAVPKKPSRSRALATALLKIAALSVIGFFVWSVMQKFIPVLYPPAAMSSEKIPAVASASITTVSQQAAATNTVPAKTSADLR